jgi:hypothetical protein
MYVLIAVFSSLLDWSPFLTLPGFAYIQHVALTEHVATPPPASVSQDLVGSAFHRPSSAILLPSSRLFRFLYWTIRLRRLKLLMEQIPMPPNQTGFLIRQGAFLEMERIGRLTTPKLQLVGFSLWLVCV